MWVCGLTFVCVEKRNACLLRGDGSVWLTESLPSYVVCIWYAAQNLPVVEKPQKTRKMCGAEFSKHAPQCQASKTLTELERNEHSATTAKQRGYRCTNTRNMIHSIMGRGSCNRDGLGLSFLRAVVAMDWRRITLTRNGTLPRGSRCGLLSPEWKGRTGCTFLGNVHAP